MRIPTIIGLITLLAACATGPATFAPSSPAATPTTQSGSETPTLLATASPPLLTPTRSCPPGSRPNNFGCAFFTPEPTATLYVSPTPRPTQDMHACVNLHLPWQFWLLSTQEIEAYLDQLDGSCVIVAFDGKVIQDPITFAGQVAAFSGTNPVRIILDAPPLHYSVVWGLLKKPSSGAPTYVISVLQVLRLPDGEAPFGDGAYIISPSNGVEPGPWRTVPNVGAQEDGCHWEQTTPRGKIYNNHYGSSVTHVALAAPNAFQSTGCGPWFRVGFSIAGTPVTFISAAEANDPCHNRYDRDGTCHSNEATWKSCLAAGRCYEKYP
jgi:hypothetical protein